jgi:hypothetical protein
VGTFRPVLLTAALLAPLACREEDRPLLAAFDEPGGEPKSLRETFDFLREAHRRKSYLALRPYLDPAERDVTIDLLTAVDELLAANAAAQQAVARAAPLAPREQWDVSAKVLDTLELFSREVHVVGQREDPTGQTGEIWVLIAGEPPPVTARFVRRNGHWVYSPGTGGAALVQAYRGLTRALERVARAVASAGTLTPEQVEYEYRLRLEPQLRQMRTLWADRLRRSSS